MMKRLWLLDSLFALALCAVTIGASRAESPVVAAPADATGECAVSGTLAAGDRVALFCALRHAEAVPLIAGVETGAMDVQASVLRASGAAVLVAFHNTGPAPVDMAFARIRLYRAAPATPQPAPRPPYERCVFDAIEHGDDPTPCALIRGAERTTPAAATAGVE